MIKINTEIKPYVLVYPKHKNAVFISSNFPTKSPVIVKDLEYRFQKVNIDSVLKEAKKNPLTLYYVTGFEPAIDFAPMFAKAPVNVVLPKKWIDILGFEKDRKYWRA